MDQNSRSSEGTGFDSFLGVETVSVHTSSLIPFCIYIYILLLDDFIEHFFFSSSFFELRYPQLGELNVYA